MPGTPKGEAARRRIVDAAWELSDRQGIEQVLAGVTLREVARAAGMSPSAVTYHFPTMRELGLAMVERLIDTMSLAPVDQVEELLSLSVELGLATMVRLAAQADWEALTSEEEARWERRVLRCRGATVGHPDAEHVRDLLRGGTDRAVQALAEVYERTGERLEVRPVEPLTFQDVSRAAGAISIGLLHSWMLDGDSVREELVGDLLVAFASAVLVPAPRRVDVAALSADLPGPRRDGDPDEEIEADMAAAEAAAPLFVAGVAPVTLTEVAAAVDLEPATVLERFGSVRGVAAASFRRHLPAVIAAAGRRERHGARVQLADAVHELGRAVLADRHCALALLHERQERAVGAAAGASGASTRPDPASPRDIRRLVPLTVPLLAPVATVSGRAEAPAAALADLVVDVLLGQGSTHPGGSLVDLTELAIRLVPGDAPD